MHRHLKLAWPFTILREKDTVRLVAGEDIRYTLQAPGLDQWFADWLPLLDGRRPLNNLLALLPANYRTLAEQLVQGLLGERVLVEANGSDAHRGGCGTPRWLGSATLVKRLRPMDMVEGNALAPFEIFCQDQLDFQAAREQNRQAHRSKRPWIWVSVAPWQRAYVGPLFLPDAGPCFECLFRNFRRLSPVPELYTSLLEHPGPFTPIDFPEEGLRVLEGAILWKIHQAGEKEPSPGLYRLHVLELHGLEVSSHQVFQDPECPSCRGRGP